MKAAIGIGLLRALLTYGLAYMLTMVWDYQGLAFGFSLAFVINFFFFIPLFCMSTPFNGGWISLFAYVGKLVMASLPALALGLALNLWSIHDWMKFNETIPVLSLTLSSIASIGFYFLILRWMQVREIAAVVDGIRTWRQRKLSHSQA